MKLPHCLLAIHLVFILSCTQEEKPASVKDDANRNNDETAIRETIANETRAFVNRDSTRILSYYTKDSVTQSAWNNGNGAYTVLHGFEAISENFRKAFKANPERQILPEIERSGWYFKPLSRDWMWINFTQKYTATNGKVYTSYETRLMKQESGQWKIAVMLALSDHAVVE
jgi:hypothetical protein